MLLTALQDAGSLSRYVPFDVSDEFLRSAATTLSEEFDSLDIHLVIGDFHHHLAEIPDGGTADGRLPRRDHRQPDPTQRARFLFDLNCTMSSDDSLLLGTDLVKDRARLVAAYDDAAGVTADFNRNVLHVLNEQLGGDFDPDLFRHVALWNEDEQWIEMRLRAEEATEVSLDRCGHHRPVRRGRRPADRDQRQVHARASRATSSSQAGFVVEGMWGAEDGEFLLTLAHPSADAAAPRCDADLADALRHLRRPSRHLVVPATAARVAPAGGGEPATHRAAPAGAHSRPG